MNHYQSIPLSQLTPSPDNVRSVQPDSQAHAELKASIEAHGLLYPLQVTTEKDNSYHVVDGCRRLAALKEIIKQDDPVPCLILNEQDNAREISLTGNIMRTAMHPADQFVAFNRLIEDGLTEEQISQRFGITAKTVKQRLKLARLAPELLDAYRQGKIDLETCMAFTLNDDHKQQLEVFGSFQGFFIGAGAVRNALTEQSLPGNRGIGRFVYEDYVQAGHPISCDLFADEERGDHVHLDDPTVAHAIAGEKLQKEADRLVQEEGWKWATVCFERDYREEARYGNLQKEPSQPTKAEEKELQRIEQRMAKLEDNHSEKDYPEIDELEEKEEAILEKIAERAQWTPEIKRQGGCIVTVSHTGDLDVIEGLITREDKRAAESRESEKPDAQTGGYSQALSTSLREARTAIVRNHLAASPETALDLLLYGLSTAFNDLLSNPTHLSAPWKTQRFKPESLPGSFAEIEALSSQERNDLLAQCVAAFLKEQLATDARINPAFERITERLEIDFAAHWRPTADTYWNHLTKAHILDIAENILGAHWAESFAKAKKTELIKAITEVFAAKTPPPGITREVFDRVSKWVPQGFPPFDDGKSPGDRNPPNQDEQSAAAESEDQEETPLAEKESSVELKALDEHSYALIGKGGTEESVVIAECHHVKTDDDTADDEKPPLKKDAVQTKENNPPISEEDAGALDIPEFLKRT